jgi:hypothetical protein
MNKISTTNWRDVRSCLNQRDQSIETWSIHVDELAQWRPKKESLDAWLAQLQSIYNDALLVVADDAVVAVTLCLEPSTNIEMFKKPKSLTVDLLTPPSLYVLKPGLSFPSAGEEYYRVLNPSEFGCSISHGTMIGRSARSVQELESAWEFDNTIYIASRFGD